MSCDAAYSSFDSKEQRIQLRDMAHVKAKATAEACVQVLAGGADLKVQCGYLHDMVYQWPIVWQMIGLLARATMQGFEHANKVMGAIIRCEVSQGGRKRKEDGGRKDEFQQMLEHRRAGTVAQQECMLVNRASKVLDLVKGVALVNEQRLSSEGLLAKLAGMKAECVNGEGETHTK